MRLGGISINNISKDKFDLSHFKIKNMKNLKMKRIKEVIAYIYLYACFVFFVFNFSYYLQISVKPLGSLMITVYFALLYIVFILINHLIIKRIIANKIILIIESILLLTLFALFNSDTHAWNYYG